MIYLIFSKYFRPLHKLVQTVDALQTDDRQQAEFRNYRQTDIFQNCLKCTDILGLEPFFRKSQKQWELKSNPRYGKKRLLLDLKAPFFGIVSLRFHEFSANRTIWRFEGFIHFFPRIILLKKNTLDLKRSSKICHVVLGTEGLNL